MTVILLFLVACRPSVIAPDPPPDHGDTGKEDTDDTDTDDTDDTDTDDTDTDDTDTDDTDTDTDTDTDVDTGPVDTGEVVVYDCAALPEIPSSVTELNRPRGYHDVDFDPDGNLIGWDGNSLLKVTYDDDVQLYVPGVTDIEGMARLRDGDLAGADLYQQRLVRISPEGALTTLATDVGTVYGVTTGPDGMLYVANQRSVLRVDPDTGEKTKLFDARRYQTHVVNFNLDSTRMYVGTIGRGTVYYVDLDEDLNPIGEPQVFAEGVGAGWHDGLGVDACGNLFVADYSSGGLYRVTPDGVVTRFVDWNPGNRYGHGLEWGNGIGGWRADALYLPQPYDGLTVVEVVVGVPNGNRVRTWKGVPAEY